MEKRGLVQPMECREDGRGAFVSIMPRGWTAIEQAASNHVSVVRRLMLCFLSETEATQLGQVLDKVLARLGDR